MGDSANLDARLNEGKKERRDGKEVSIMERRKGRGEGRKKIYPGKRLIWKGRRTEGFKGKDL